jgi:hypothetical protein
MTVLKRRPALTRKIIEEVCDVILFGIYDKRNISLYLGISLETFQDWLNRGRDSKDKKDIYFIFL